MSETMTGSLAEAGQRPMVVPSAEQDIDRLVSGQHHDPHAVLGAHALPSGSHGEDTVVVRAWRPDALGVTLVADDQRTEMRRVHPAGVFEGTLPERLSASNRLAIRFADDLEVTFEDPYRFPWRREPLEGARPRMPGVRLRCGDRQFTRQLEPLESHDDSVPQYRASAALSLCYSPIRGMVPGALRRPRR